MYSDPNQPSHTRSLTIKAAAFCVIAFMLQAVIAPSAHAFVSIAFQNVGPDLVATYSGTINTAALTTSGAPASFDVVQFDADATKFIVANSVFDGTLSLWGGTSPSVTTSMSTLTTTQIGGTVMASSDSFGIISNGGFIYLASSYVSGAPLSGSVTFSSTSIAGEGLIDGFIAASWGSGATSDFVVISTTAVPEPSIFGAIAGLGALLLVGCKRRRRQLAE